jgi:hypothetical protein
MVICHMAQSETTREAIPFDFPGLDSSVVEHLAYIQEAWVQSLVWPDLDLGVSIHLETFQLYDKSPIPSVSG